jgi:hypothetical protein
MIYLTQEGAQVFGNKNNMNYNYKLMKEKEKL